MKLSAFAFFGMITAPAVVLGVDESVDIEALKRELRELRQRTEQLERKLDSLQSAPAITNAIPPPPGATNVTATIPAPSSAPPGEPVPRWSPTNPIAIGNSQNYINVSFDVLGTVGTTTADDVEFLQRGGHDPSQRGFSLQNAEVTLEGKVDPYLRGQVNLAMHLTPDNETELELEEAYLETLSLPGNLQLRAGQMLTEFGRINPMHAHTWDFLDSPLVNTRILGADGLRNPGARLSWLMPTPFYSELFFAVQNSGGETAHSFRADHEDLFFGRETEPGQLHNFGDFLFVPRYAMSFDLTDTQTLLAGTSAAFGPNASTTGTQPRGDTDTQIYGVDLFWKWKSAHHHAGFPFVTWQTEAMFRRYQAAETDVLPAELIRDYGFYSQIAYGFRKGWVAALRYDYVAPEGPTQYEAITGPDLERTSRWRISPNLTWYPSEFSKVRLQYNFDHRNQIGDDHSVWIQFEFLLGSHAAHKF